jgi:ATP phosphoribosyltransferase
LLPFAATRRKARSMLNPLTFAVPKGRLLDEALPIMAEAGIVPDAEFRDKKSRALSFACENSDMRIIRVRAFDVATFVAHGAAAVGIVGSDVVEEFAYPDLYAPVDLDIGHCRLSIAQPVGSESEPPTSHLRVASKYPGLTRRHFESLGVQAEVVKLNGAMELAPGLGLASRIVDLVETGRTLKDNGLAETSVILKVSARLIVNRAALKTDERVAQLVERFRAVVAAAKTAAGAAA